MNINRSELNKLQSLYKLVCENHGEHEQHPAEQHGDRVQDAIEKLQDAIGNYSPRHTPWPADPQQQPDLPELSFEDMDAISKKLGLGLTSDEIYYKLPSRQKEEIEDLMLTYLEMQLAD